jgi:hypothetical protein
MGGIWSIIFKDFETGVIDNMQNIAKFQISYSDTAGF